MGCATCGRVVGGCRGVPGARPGTGEPPVAVQRSGSRSVWGDRISARREWDSLPNRSRGSVALGRGALGSDRRSARRAGPPRRLATPDVGLARRAGDPGVALGVADRSATPHPRSNRSVEPLGARIGPDRSVRSRALMHKWIPPGSPRSCEENLPIKSVTTLTYALIGMPPRGVSARTEPGTNRPFRSWFYVPICVLPSSRNLATNRPITIILSQLTPNIIHVPSEGKNAPPGDPTRHR